MAASIKTNSLKAPYQEAISDKDGLLTRIWQTFFIKVQSAVQYLGPEYAFNLANNQSSAAVITDLLFDFQYTSSVLVDYLIQRKSSTTELIQSGQLRIIYRPKTLTWSIYDPSPSGDAAGITFSITSVGQVKYTSTNMGGTASISRLVFRTRELAGKTSLYSKVG